MKATTSKIFSFCCVMALVFLLTLSGAAVAANWTPPKIEKPKSFPKYPERPIELICPWGVGGGADLQSRTLADLVRKHYGITVVVTNMPGAAGMKGIDYAMRQPHDGYTIFHCAWDGYMNYLLKKTTWKPEEIYFFLRGMNTPGAYFVRKDSPFKTWQEVIDYSKKNPYKLRVADVGRGGLGDLTLGLWEKFTGIKLTYVPFDEPGQRYSAFSGAHTDLLYEQPGDIPSILEAGARALVFMSEKRQPGFENTPTARELGADITIALWRGLALAADTPKEIRDYLVKIFDAVGQSPEFQEYLKANKADPDSVLSGEKAMKMFLDEYKLVSNMMSVLQQ